MDQGEDLEMKAAKAAASFIKKEARGLNYSLIALCSGEAGPEIKTMELLKQEGYILDKLTLVDINPPSKDTLKFIKKNYTQQLSCLNFPEIKKQLLIHSPSDFEDTICISIHYQVGFMGFIEPGLAQQIINVHTDPWTWLRNANIPSNTQKMLAEVITRDETGKLHIQDEYKKIIHDYYSKWLKDMDYSDNEQIIFLNNLDESIGLEEPITRVPSTIQLNAMRVINRAITDEVGEFFWLWLGWYKKSIGFAWRDQKIGIVSIEHLQECCLKNDMISVPYATFLKKVLEIMHSSRQAVPGGRKTRKSKA